MEASPITGHRILITGASGLIGSALTAMLLNGDGQVFHLGRTKSANGIPSFSWDISRRRIDPGALEGVDTIIHLAGASVAPARWTTKRKKEIMDSRVESTRLLREVLSSTGHNVRTLICASGVNYYGYGKYKTFREEDPAGDDFLARVTRAWETEADRFSELGIRVVKLRIGMVLSGEGGALRVLALPVKYFLGAALGDGEQPISWIHITDLCRIIAKAIQDRSMSGSYNVVAPEVVTNREMTKGIARVLHRPMLPAVPAFAMKLALGELAEMVLNGTRASCEKIRAAGYAFTFPELMPALGDALRGETIQ